MKIVRFNHHILGEVFLEEIAAADYSVMKELRCMKGEATPPSVSGMFPGTLIPVDTKAFSGDLLVTTVRSNGVVTLKTNGRYSV